jgi:hypothetical protein
MAATTDGRQSMTTRDLIGGGQLERQMTGLSWRIEAIMKKLADVDGEDDDNMRNYSRGYEDDVNSRDHVRNISECHARIREGGSRVIFTFFLHQKCPATLGAVHFPLFGGTHDIIALCLSFSFGHDDEETGQVTRGQRCTRSG